MLHIFWPQPYLFSSHARTRQNIAILKQTGSPRKIALHLCQLLRTLAYKPLRSRRRFTSFLGAHSAKVELCERASIRLACFAGTCQILVTSYDVFGTSEDDVWLLRLWDVRGRRPIITSVRRLWDIRRWRLIITSVRRYFVNAVLKSYRNWKKWYRGRTKANTRHRQGSAN